MTMARYVLHSFLILVIAQLTSVAAGLVMTEREAGRVRHELKELQEAIEETQKFQIPVLQVTAVTPTEAVRLTVHEMTARARMLSQHLATPVEETAESNLSSMTKEAQETARNEKAERYFHKLCRLTI